MIGYILKRTAFAVLTLWVVATAVFALFFVANPGNVAQRFAGRNATPEMVELAKHRLGLDLPRHEQYLKFLNQLAHGDLGTSFLNHEPVLHTLALRLPVTASLVLVAALLWTVLGVSLGILAATRPRSRRDRFTTGFALIGMSMPTFVLGLILLYMLFYKPTVAGFPALPASGFVPLTSGFLPWLSHLILPGLTIALTSAAAYARMTRSTLLETLSEDYIRTARAKGLSERRVTGHALRAALAPIVTMLGLDVGALLGGAVITERLFGLPGIGASALQAISVGDLPVIMGTVILGAFAVVVANAAVDILYALLDPRVRAR